MVIAVDFDGTLCTAAYPEIGVQEDMHLNIADYLRWQKSLGATIVLWTCREDTAERLYLAEAVQWCKDNDIPIDEVNAYVNPLYADYPARKVSADIYIDDRCIPADYFKHIWRRDD